MQQTDRLEVKVDRAIDLLTLHAQESRRHREEQDRVLTHLTEAVARLDERSRQHERRMDRTERRAKAGGAGLGAVVATLVTALAEVIRRLPG